MYLRTWSFAPVGTFSLTSLQPVGHHTDLRKLLPGAILSDQIVSGIARAYNTTNGRIVQDGDNKARP